MTGAAWVSVAGVAVLSWLGCKALITLAPQLGLVPEPQLHSAHDRPTPVGGGLAIALAMVLMATGLAVVDALPWNVVFLIGAGLPVALVGWLDDRKPLTPLVRLPVHLVSATLGLAVIGFPESSLLIVLAVLLIGWAINLYNFMDGIDGLAGSQALLIGMAGGVFFVAGGLPGYAWIAFATALAAAGFLYWNLSPARIFLGDVGSGYLGYLFGVLAVASHLNGGPSVLIWMALLGVFGFDASVTLLRRFLRGDRWYAGHREHAYQRAVRAGFTHSQVTWTLLGFTAVMAGIAGTVWALEFPPATALILATGCLAIGYSAVEWLLPLGFGRYEESSEDSTPSPTGTTSGHANCQVASST